MVFVGCFVQFAYGRNSLQLEDIFPDSGTDASTDASTYASSNTGGSVCGVHWLVHKLFGASVSVLVNGSC